jgi:hypothetical protein
MDYYLKVIIPVDAEEDQQGNVHHAYGPVVEFSGTCMTPLLAQSGNRDTSTNARALGDKAGIAADAHPRRGLTITEIGKKMKCSSQRAHTAASFDDLQPGLSVGL